MVDGRSPGTLRLRRPLLEWRGIVTLGALRTLVSYDRLQAGKLDSCRPPLVQAPGLRRAFAANRGRARSCRR